MVQCNMIVRCTMAAETKDYTRGAMFTMIASKTG